jgi:hypothetical protein
MPDTHKSRQRGHAENPEKSKYNFNLRTILTITNIKTLGTDTGGVLLC